MVVAGTMVAPSFVVRNDSSQEVTLSAGVTSVRNPAEPPRTPDPREFLAIPRTEPPGAYETRVQPGQTRDIMSTAQLPFQVDQAGLLRAGASLGVLAPNALFSSRVTSVQVEIPLQVRAATPADELHLELKTDSQQWCLRATDSRGAQPSGPLFLARQVVGARITSLGEVPSATGDAWAERWSQMGSPSMLAAGPATLTVWVGGPHYVTSRAEAIVAGGP
jgi:hypothetical protein